MLRALCFVYIFYASEVSANWILDKFFKSNDGRSDTDRLTIEVKKLVDWDNLFAAFMKSRNLTANFPGLVVKGIVCPSKSSHCPSKDVTFQPKILAIHGGICGVDITPVNIGSKQTRVFLMPQLVQDGITASEGARGIVASSTGYVFDLSGGCYNCITIYPHVGQKIFLEPSLVHRRGTKK